MMRMFKNQGKPVAPSNLHVTLVFLGSVDASMQTAITQAASQIAIQPMSLTFDRLNYWKKPAVVCLTAEQIDPAVSSLVAQLSAAANQLGIALDERPYKPHVTLLRKAHSLPSLEFNPIHWQAESFCLVESCSLPGGVEYRVLQCWPSIR
jgi:RNA 2',3'-cyclic 3'-phosphodiesterase